MAAVQATAWPGRVFLTNAAVCWLLVGTAFLTRRPSFFRKRADGRLPLFSRVLLWPYLLLNELALIAVGLSREREADEIVPGLFLSRRPPLFRMRGASPAAEYVLDVTCEFPRSSHLRTAAHYRCLPVLDTLAPTPGQLTEGVAFLREGIDSGAEVVVHCALGHGRSAVFLCGYLLAKGLSANVAEAEARVRQSRPGVALNAEQRAALERYLAELRR